MHKPDINKLIISAIECLTLSVEENTTTWISGNMHTYYNKRCAIQICNHINAIWANTVTVNSFEYNVALLLAICDRQFVFSYSNDSKMLYFTPPAMKSVVHFLYFIVYIYNIIKKTLSAS